MTPKKIETKPTHPSNSLGLNYFKKNETKEDHHTNQHPTLSRGKTRKVGISRRRAALDGGRRIRPQPDSGREAHDKICSRSICEGSLSHTVHKPSAT